MECLFFQSQWLSCWLTPLSATMESPILTITLTSSIRVLAQLSWIRYMPCSNRSKEAHHLSKVRNHLRYLSLRELLTTKMPLKKKDLSHPRKCKHQGLVVVLRITSVYKRVDSRLVGTILSLISHSKLTKMIQDLRIWWTRAFQLADKYHRHPKQLIKVLSLSLTVIKGLQQPLVIDPWADR